MSSSKRSTIKPIWVLVITLAIFGGMAETCGLEKLSPTIKWIIGEEEPGGMGSPGDATSEAILPSTAESPGNISGPLKPVRFVNNGTVAATVMAWTYVPLGTESPTTPSDASTVTTPQGNTSSYLSLPLGTYTWCYHWELGDINNDGYIEYAHAFDDRPVLLDESDSDSLDFAERVDLSVPPGSGELPGLCGTQGALVIAWGNEGSFWQVEVLNGIVVGGASQGNVTWTAVEGTFDGTNLYVLWQEMGNSDCSSRLQQWWQIDATTATHLRSLNGCGIERTDQFVMTRTR